MKQSGIFIRLLLFMFVGIVTFRMVYLSIFKSESYEMEYEAISNRVVYGASAPRGRILDVNGKVLVDNVGVNTVIYNKIDNKKGTSEVELARELGKILKYDEKIFTEYKIKKFYIADHGGCKDLITEEEWDLYEKRKLKKEDLESLKYDRITKEMIDALDYDYKNASYIYAILNTGYYYENKVLKKDLNDEEVVAINDLGLSGIKTILTWERIYPYGDTLKTVFGTISTNGVPKEYKEYFAEKGVNMASTVGTSALEFQYDDYLRGTSAKYKIEGGNLVLLEKESPGADLYLSIDIDKQLEIEKILKAEMLNAKKVRNTGSYNHSYVIVGNPKDGSIVAMTGLLFNKDHFSDVTINVINSSYTVGSIVKGASISVGYQQGLIEMGRKVLDSCIKVYNVPQKCSWTRLGYIDDIRALAQSSNYYQFLIATRLTNPNYKWNSRLNATKEAFDIYRNMLGSYGLGVKTGIDLPNENVGIIGKTVSDDLLLNLAIGQYDTYTPIEVFQYISTVANDGVRLKPSLMHKIVKDDRILLSHSAEEVGKVDLEDKYIERVQKGLNEVIRSGTGYNYTNHKINAAGKTGTSETFVDSDGDGKIDTQTTSTSFVMYAPFDNPEYSVVIMSPHIAQNNGGYTYKYSINMRVNRQIFSYLFG